MNSFRHSPTNEANKRDANTLFIKVRSLLSVAKMRNNLVFLQFGRKFGVRIFCTFATMNLIQKHCFECGTALIEKELEGEGIVPYCPKCEQYRFPMYNVAVSMIVINEQTSEILLIKQYGRPWFVLVAGYVNRGEQVEHAVGREIKEKFFYLLFVLTIIVILRFQTSRAMPLA